MASHRDGSRRRRRPVLVPVSLLVAAAGLAVAALLGGFAEAPPEPPETLGKGDTIDQVRIRTTFTDAVARRGGDDFGVSDKRYLLIHLNVTNLSDETVSAHSVVSASIPTVRADGKVIKGEELDDLGPRIVINEQGRYLNQIHPRLTRPVIMAFELPPDGTAPQQVELDVATFEWRESFFYETHSWVVALDEIPGPGGDRTRTRYVPRVVAKVEMPVRVEGDL